MFLRHSDTNWAKYWETRPRDLLRAVSVLPGRRGLGLETAQGKLKVDKHVFPLLILLQL